MLAPAAQPSVPPVIALDPRHANKGLLPLTRENVQMVKLGMQDALFLALETPEAPMHIGLLMTCKLPEGATPDFVQELYASLKRTAVDSEPFNLRLGDTRGVARLAPTWELAKEINLNYHLRFESLARPGGEKELELLISRLHSLSLARSRPLWEFTLIEGLHRERFALYLKIHHSLGDGVGLINRVVSALAESPHGTTVPPWAVPSETRVTARPTQAVDENWRQFLEELFGIIGGTRKRASETPLIPRGPRCVLNGNNTSRRCLATQDLSLQRIKAIAHAAEASVNDVILAICSGALRKYLGKFDRVPKDSLLATVPVAVRRPDGATMGSAVATIHAAIATNERDPLKRLLAIRETMRVAKEEFRIVPLSLHRVINAFGLHVMMLIPRFGYTDPEHSAFTNLVISNVPGPREPLYFCGAAIDGMYPLSVLPGDHRLNITVLSYSDHLDFGLVACPDTLPGLESLAAQLPVALRDLEAAVGPGRPGRRRALVKRAKRIPRAGRVAANRR